MTPEHEKLLRSMSASKAGKASAAALTNDQRAARAKKAADARWHPLVTKRKGV